MTSAIAVITYRRLSALRTTLAGIKQHCPGYPLAVFEDCGNRDGTSNFLGAGPRKVNDELMADEFQHPDGYQAFLGRVNLGVAGNSNRALRWFEKGGWDHLCLLNDDLHVMGDFVKFYGKAHNDLKIGFFCFNDFWDSETHRWIIARSRGYRLKVFPRMTGIMCSLTKSVVQTTGYFDTRFGKFGEEHCDYTNRARFAGHINLDGQAQMCMDVEPTLPDGKAGPPVLKHQEVASSVVGPDRERANQYAAEAMQAASIRYHYEHYYQPFRLIYPPIVGGVNGQGIQSGQITGYHLLNSCR